MASGAKNDFWRGRRVYVTGATGLLGSALCEALAERGADLVALVRDDVRRSRFWDLLERYPAAVVRGDVSDLPLQERAINEYEIETVFHLAAQTIVGTANRSPAATFETNIGGTWAVLEAARRLDFKGPIVVASSDKAYGAQPNLPYTEASPLEGRHPYDVSKSCADLIATAYFKSYGLPVAIVRCANLFGPGDLNFNRILPGTIQSVLRGEPPVVRSDGSYLRDYLYVREAAEAYLMLAEAMDNPKIRGEAFNFSAGKPLRVLELVEMILKAMKSPLRPVVENRATNEIPEQYLDSAKARAMLGWKPRFSFEDALRETIDWYAAEFARGARG